MTSSSSPRRIRHAVTLAKAGIVSNIVSSGPLSTGYSNPNILNLSQMLTKQVSEQNTPSEITQTLGRPIRDSDGVATINTFALEGVKPSITATQVYSQRSTEHYQKSISYPYHGPTQESTDPIRKQVVLYTTTCTHTDSPALPMPYQARIATPITSIQLTPKPIDISPSSTFALGSVLYKIAVDTSRFIRKIARYSASPHATALRKKIAIRKAKAIIGLFKDITKAEETLWEKKNGYRDILNEIYKETYKTSEDIKTSMIIKVVYKESKQLYEKCSDLAFRVLDLKGLVNEIKKKPITKTQATDIEKEADYITREFAKIKKSLQPKKVRSPTKHLKKRTKRRSQMYHSTSRATHVQKKKKEKGALIINVNNC